MNVNENPRDVRKGKGKGETRMTKEPPWDDTSPFQGIYNWKKW